MPERGREDAATAADYFGGMVASYDSLIRRAVPRYDEMTARLIAYLPQEARRVLELGCGTGNLSLALGERFPDASYTFVDASPEMVEIARARFATVHGDRISRARFVVEHFQDLTFDHGAYDLVVSSISLHHVQGKGGLYRRIRDWLESGGHLCFADQFRGATEAIHARNWSRWLAFCREPGHCTREEIESLLAHAEAHDHYTPVAEHFELLGRAGFAGLDCIWRDGMWGIVVAVANGNGDGRP